MGYLDHRGEKWKITALSCAVTAALLAACGGDGDSTPAVAVPQNNGLRAEAPAEFSAPVATLAQSQLHLNNATANAGKSDLFVNVLRPQWCHGAENAGTPPELQDRAVVPATKIFDDTYFMGPRWVGQYVFKTNSGLFLLDTLNNQTEVQTITEPQLRSLGLDPATIKAAMPTHGHGDHHGGGAYLQTTYGIPIYLGSGDAANKPFTVTPLSTENLSPQPLTVDGLEMTVLSTPGHTPGTFSGVIPVKHNGTPYKVAFWGGTGMPNTTAAARQYLEGTERLYQLARAQGIDGTIHTHPFVDGSLAHIDAIRANGLGAQNPFLLGKQDALRSLTVLRNCSAAKVTQVDATAVLPEWRFSTVEAAATWVKGQVTNNLSASARVKSPYGVLNSGTVTFAFAPGGEQCTANVGANGIATCSVSSAGATQQSVTVSYAGTESPSTVNLPASASAQVTALN
jgi:glyoxylase-like metal-dependent hydrolase (beta-lactamase superfamily II)